MLGRQGGVGGCGAAQHAKRIGGQAELLIGGLSLPEAIPAEDQGAHLVSTADAHCIRGD